DPDLWMVTVFGLGYLRPAPGTWGSLPSVLIAAALVAAGAGPGHWAYYAAMIALALVFTVSCVALGDQAQARFWTKDPSQAVADEPAGAAGPLLFLPPAAPLRPVAAALSLLGAFLAFRFMDIVKPFPARRIQSVPGGWGVVLDDLVAGVYAGLAVLIGWWIA